MRTIGKDRQRHAKKACTARVGLITAYSQGNAVRNAGREKARPVKVGGKELV